MTDMLLRVALVGTYIGLVFTSHTKLQRIVAVTLIAVSAVVEVATR